ncbi:MAG: hypothetical protein HWD60_16375 [Defluviicoccus sp.]|nr:MAG: hypothetical protein HWD60_16375 [Defluviicoccus sp.]
MCEKIIERLSSMTAEDRQQLRQNCARAIARSPDHLVVQEARRIIAELDALENRESRFLGCLPTARKIEYAFRRLPASEQERQLIRALHENAGATTRRVSAALGNIDDLSWLRRMCEMFQNRRHLIGEGTLTEDPMPMESRATLVAAALLLEIGETGQAVRLSPEAVAAFTSIGYINLQAA